MLAADGRRDALLLFCVPALIVALGCAMTLLPHAGAVRLAYCLAAWSGLSFPLAVLAGYCVLSEE